MTYPNFVQCTDARFVFEHVLDAEQTEQVKALYMAGEPFAFTCQADGQTYQCTFAAAPTVKPVDAVCSVVRVALDLA